MKKKFLTWLYNYLQPNQKYTKEQIKKINSFKSTFRNYFEGCYDDYEPVVNIPLGRLEINDLLFTFKNEMLIITVVCGRPGILIGKGGNVIDGLNTYLLQDKMKVDIKESKLWQYLKY